MRKISVLAAVAAVCSGGLAALAGPAEAIEDPVHLRVEHDLDDEMVSVGPLVLEVTGAVIGDGPELTAAHETSNPSDWNGNVLVDIDDEAKTITVEVEHAECFDSVVVVIDTPEITGITTVADGLFAGDDPPVALATSVADGSVRIAWESVDPAVCPNLGEVAARAVFSYRDTSPVEPSPVEPAPAAPLPAAPAPAEPAPAEPAPVAPTFTG